MSVKRKILRDISSLIKLYAESGESFDERIFGLRLARSIILKRFEEEEKGERTTG